MKRSILFTACLLVTSVTSITLLTVSSAHAQLGPMGISNDGLKFPDGSEQTTAAVSPATYTVGGTGPAGGFVFWVTDDGLHGLEAAPGDIGGGIWGCYGTDVIPATANQGLGKGASNTNDIIRGCSEAEAAVMASEYTSPSGYFDWYLPSIQELVWMHLNLHLEGLGDFTAVGYWSSSEWDEYSAYSMGFMVGGEVFTAPKDGVVPGVRPVRVF